MRKIFLLPVFLLVVTMMQAQHSGKVIEQITVKSAILPHAVNYTVYLPADYESSQRTYPVVYLLHGYTDDNTGWLQFGEINRLADKAIADGTIPPMIIVMPDADSTWYINSYDGKEKFEDFFLKEFMPTVEKTWRIKGEKRFRGVAGLSMGGYGTMIYALKHPDLFAAAAPLSSAVLTDDDISTMPDDRYNFPFAPLYGRGLKGTDRLNKAWYDNSVLKLVETLPENSLKSVRYWIDCGDDDFLTIGNSMLHIGLTKRRIPHEYRVREGAHTWNYWRTGIIDALAFIGQSFHQ